jgi:hypothetical protein
VKAAPADLHAKILDRLDKLDAVIASAGDDALVTITLPNPPPTLLVGAKQLTTNARGLLAEHPTGRDSIGTLFCEPCDDAAMQTGRAAFPGFPCQTLAFLADMIGVQPDAP